VVDVCPAKKIKEIQAFSQSGPQFISPEVQAIMHETGKKMRNNADLQKIN